MTAFSPHISGNKLVKNAKQYAWSTTEGFDIFSYKDNYSEFQCILSDNRCIAVHLECDLKRYDVGGSRWSLGRGKAPARFISEEALYEEYLDLWQEWATLNPARMAVLRKEAAKHNYLIKDNETQGALSPARALADILNAVNG